MRLCLSPFLWIFALCVILCSSKAVDPVSDFILPLGRVVNAITLQKQLCNNPNLATAIIGELINVDKTGFEKILKSNLKEQVSELSAASTFIDKIPTVDAKHIDKTINGLQALTTAKKEESRLTVESFKDPTTLLESSSTIDTKILWSKKNINKANFAMVEKVLKEIQKTEGKNVDKTNLDSWLTLLASNVEFCHTATSHIANYKDAYKDFYAFSTLSAETDPYIKISKSIATVAQNFDDISAFDSAAPVLANQSSNLRSSKSNFEKFAIQLREIENTLKTAMALSGSSSKRQLSPGLSNGFLDLKKLSNDMKNPFMVEQFGKGMSSISDALAPLSKTSSALETAAKEFQGSKLDPTIPIDFGLFQNLFLEVLTVVKSATQNQDIEKELQKLTPCVKLLQKDPNVPQFKNLDQISSHVAKINAKLKSFDQVMKDINIHKGFPTFKADIETLFSKTSLLGVGADQQEQIDMWNSIRALNFLGPNSAVLSIIQKLEPNPFKLGGQNLPVSILKETLESANRLNLFNALKCLPASSPDISQLIASGKKVDKLKSQKSKLTAVTPVLSSLLSFQTSANKAVAQLKKTAKHDDTKVISDELSDGSVKKVEKFVMATGLLNNADMIRKSDSSISKVINPIDPVKQAAEQVPGADFYSDKFRKSIGGLVTSVKEFFKSVSSMPVKSLKDVLKVVDNLTKLKGHSLKDVDKLSDPIAKQLAQSSDPQVKDAAKDFETAGGLGMDFASFSIVSPLEKDLLSFFDPFLTTEKHDSDEGTPISYYFLNPIAYAIYGLIVTGGLVGSVLTGLWCCKKWPFKKTKRNQYDVESGGSKKKRKRRAKIVSKSRKAKRNGRKQKKKGGNQRNPKKNKTELDVNVVNKQNVEKKNPVEGLVLLAVNDRKDPVTKQPKMRKLRSELTPDPPKKKKSRGCCGKKQKTPRNQEKPKIDAVYLRPPPLIPPPPANPKKDVVKIVSLDEEKDEEHERIAEISKQRDEEHMRVTSEDNFQKKGPIHFPLEIIIPLPAELPDGIVLENVRYDPSLNEMWEIGSDVDDMEFDSSFHVSDLSDSDDPSTKSTQASSKKQIKKKKLTKTASSTSSKQNRSKRDDEDDGKGSSGTETTQKTGVT